MRALIVALMTVSVVAAAALLLPGPRTEAAAEASLALSGAGSDLASGLIVEIKSKKKCKKVFVCDFFAPASSCANPPCCKKGHKEKDCEPADGAPATTPAPAPEPASGQCNLCTNKGECSPAGTPAECADHKAAAEKLTVTPFLTWSCICK